MKKLKILGIGLNGGSAQYRLWQIAKYFRKDGHEFVCASYQIGFPERVAKLCDIIVLEMMRNKSTVDKIKKLGKKIVYDADDLIHEARRDGSQGVDDKGTPEKNIENEKKRIEDNEYCIKNADLVTVTTEYLKEKLLHLNKNIVVLPNYLDIEKWPQPSRNNSNTLRIGWAGSISHKADLKQILNPVIKEVIEKHPEVRFVYCGYGGMSSEDEFTQLEYGEDMFKGVPRKNREYHLGVDTPYWPLKAASLEFDIALAPLIDDEFNKAKSNLKFLEYGLLGYPAIYSPTVYKDYVKEGVTGFIAETKEDWIKYIELLINDSKLREQIRNNARTEILEHWDIKNHWREWETAYKSILPPEPVSPKGNKPTDKVKEKVT